MGSVSKRATGCWASTSMSSLHKKPTSLNGCFTISGAEDAASASDSIAPVASSLLGAMARLENEWGSLQISMSELSNCLEKVNNSSQRAPTKAEKGISGVQFAQIDRQAILPTPAELSVAEVDDGWGAACQIIGAHDGGTNAHTIRARNCDPKLNVPFESAAIKDPRFVWLEEHAETFGRGSRGQLLITCPFKSGHSVDSGQTETAYFPAATGGYETGRFHCFHATCAGRTTADFDTALGYVEESPKVFKLGEKPGLGSPRILDPSQCMTSARSAMIDVFQLKEKPTLIRANGAWFSFSGRNYTELSEEDVRSKIWTYLDAAQKIDKFERKIPFKPTQAQVANTVDALKAVAAKYNLQPPCWISDKYNLDPAEIVSLEDGLFHIPSRKLLPHDPAFFNLNSLPFRAPMAGRAPNDFLIFLRQVWRDDIESLETLQEMFGYLLTGDTSQQKMFLIVGPRRSGKGTISRVLGALLGQLNVAAPTLTSLTTNFGLQPLIGKLAAIIPDARISGGGNTSAVVERLLMLSGEDSISIDRKNKEAWTGRLLARVVMMTNEPPRLGDVSGALPGRFITLSMSRSFYGKEDVTLTAKLLRELPQIFGWALEGRDRLLSRGHFIQPQSGKDLADELADLGSPVSVFVRDRCSLTTDAHESVDDLFGSWRDWCAFNGHYAGSKGTFSKSLRVAFPKLKPFQPRSGETGEQERSFGGIQLLPSDG